MSVLKLPVLLPCSHSVCQRHTLDSTGQITCGKCEHTHEIPKPGFPSNDAIAEVIEAQIEKLSLGLGQTHQEARDSCAQLESAMLELENRLVQPDMFVYDEIEKLKNRVLLKSEELKLRIDDETTRLLERLDSQHEKCRRHLIERQRGVEYKNVQEALRKTRTSLVSWRDELNQIDFDEARWKRIKKSSDKLTSVVCEQTRVLEFDLSLSNFADVQSDIDHFQALSIDSVFLTSYVN